METPLLGKNLTTKTKPSNSTKTTFSNTLAHWVKGMNDIIYCFLPMSSLFGREPHVRTILSDQILLPPLLFLHKQLPVRHQSHLTCFGVQGEAGMCPLEGEERRFSLLFKGRLAKLYIIFCEAGGSKQSNPSPNIPFNIKQCERVS